MIRYVFAVMLGVLFCSLPALGAPPGQGWELAKQGEGIEVYTRPVEGMDAKEFLGVADVDAPVDVVLEVFRDVPSFPGWYGFCRDIQVVRDFSDRHKIVYFVLATQWPTKDRDMVIDVMIEEGGDKEKYVLSMKALKEELVPRSRKYVRMTHIIGRYSLAEIDTDRTHVTYTVQSDPAGYIPAALSNMLAKDQPYLTLKGLREMVKEDVYYERAGLKRR